MRKSEEATSWVVYRMNIGTRVTKVDGPNAVCEQGEWDEMELSHPGHHTLVQGNMTNECEAEKLARGTSGDAKQRLPRRS